MYKKTLKKTLLVQALSAALGATALTAVVSTTAWAQSNTTGNVFGTATAGATLVVENTATGLKSRVTADSTGRYQALSLPTGTYKVQLMRGDAVIATREVEVLIAQGSEINFAATQGIETVQVTAARQTIDVSTSNGGATFTAKELAKLPVNNNVASVIQLAPNTVRGDSRYGGAGAPSFGGSSASENAYYINGFPATNVLFQIGFSPLPFGAISQAQILSGGYGAEFGRSTGGVVNITTKSGTNEWEAGASVATTPATLRSNVKNLYFPNTGKPNNVATDGTLIFYREGDRLGTDVYQGFLGGPLIKDKLFMYVNLEKTRTDFQGIRNARTSTAVSNAWQTVTTDVPRALLKLDWNVTENHHLEYTKIKDSFRIKEKYYGFNYATLQRTNVQNGGVDYLNSGAGRGGQVANGSGNNLSFGKYTGFLTENVTLTALYGTSQTKHQDSPFGLLPGVFQSVSTPSTRAPGLNYPNPQPIAGTLLVAGANDKQKAFRIDLEWKLASHAVRAGIDDNKLNSKTGTLTAGGGQWLFQRTNSPTDVVRPGDLTPAQAGGLGAQGYYVDEIKSGLNGTPKQHLSAQYIEDRWQTTKNLMLTLGLRNEQFTNFNPDGDIFLEQKRQIAPRFAAAWDVKGDSSLKVFGTAGRYHVQVPNNVAVRGATAAVNTTRGYTYTGIDQTTGAPTGLVPMGATYSPNNEFGQGYDPRTVSVKDLKANYQDEMTLGFEKAWNKSYNFGVKGTYRKLKSIIDDYCDARAISVKAKSMGVTPGQDYEDEGGQFHCYIFNPGKTNTFVIDFVGDKKKYNEITLTANELGMPVAERKYKALDFFLEHPLRNGWYGKVNYTYSKSEGNAEGQLNSDRAQVDVATTLSFDLPELVENTYGKLPNNHTHAIKAFGFYELTSEWGIGGNGVAISGRPRSCIGFHPKGPTEVTGIVAAYGTSFFYCDGKPSPRGSLGELPWDVRFDMNLTYQPKVLPGLRATLNVFNLFNRQTVQTVQETYNSSPTAVSNRFGGTLSTTPPRSVQLIVNYTFKP